MQWRGRAGVPHPEQDADGFVGERYSVGRAARLRRFPRAPPTSPLLSVWERHLPRAEGRAPGRSHVGAVIESPPLGGTAGAICSSSASTGTDLVPTHNTIVAHVGSAPAVTMDETRRRIGGKSAWLWVAATDDATIYDVAHDRDFDAATNLVAGDYAGTIVRDGWVVYNSYTKATTKPAWARPGPGARPGWSATCCWRPSTPVTSTPGVGPRPLPLTRHLPPGRSDACLYVLRNGELDDGTTSVPTSRPTTEPADPAAASRQGINAAGVGWSRKVEDDGNRLTQLGEDGGAHVAAGSHDPARRDRTKMLALSRGVCDQSVGLVRFDHDL